MQQSILGKARFEAWKAGKIDFRKLATKTHDAVRGTGLKVTQLKDLDLFAGDLTDAKTINFITMKEVNLGYSADLRDQYPQEIEERKYLRSKETLFTKYAYQHIKEDHPERIKWIEDSTNEIFNIIKSPEIIERKMRLVNNHWRQTFIGTLKELPDNYLAVVLSLANMPGEPESNYHITITVCRAKIRDFFKKDGNIKER